MRRVRSIFLIAGGSLLASLFAISLPGMDEPSGLPFRVQRMQYSAFSDDASLFLSAYARTTVRERGADSLVASYAGTEVIRAGIVSHHLFVKRLIAEYFEALSRAVHPRTVVILGPNHHARGPAPIAVTALPWKTPFGMVDADTAMVAGLVASKLVEENDDAFFHEHSVGAIVPFIRHVFPDARVVPIVFRRDADSAVCVNLGTWLAHKADATVFLLGSMDFSHYRSSAEAEEEDQRTIPVLTTCDPGRVREANVDSHPALLALLTACREEGAMKAHVLQHTNSGIITRQPLTPCTSYINTVFARRH